VRCRRHVVRPSRQRHPGLRGVPQPPSCGVTPRPLCTSTTIQRRIGRNAPDTLVTHPEALAVLGHYYDGELALQPALALLETQGVALPDAWLAIGRAQNIPADLRADGIVGERLGEDVRLTTEALAWWLQTILGTALETHIARGLWVINQLKPALPAQAVRELKARYVFHDIGKLGPLGLSPECAGMVLHSFELRRITLQQTVDDIFRAQFGTHSRRLLDEINRHQRGMRLGPQTTMRTYFDRHEAWGEQWLTQLCAEGKVAASVRRHAHRHHHIDREHAPLGIITYVDIYEASTDRMSYDAVTARETRLTHGEAMAAIWRRFAQGDRPKIAPGLATAYVHLLAQMEGLAPRPDGVPVPGSPSGRTTPIP
jgi:hypothetical protein